MHAIEPFWKFLHWKAENRRTVPRYHRVVNWFSATLSPARGQFILPSVLRVVCALSNLCVEIQLRQHTSPTTIGLPMEAKGGGVVSYQSLDSPRNTVGFISEI